MKPCVMPLVLAMTATASGQALFTGETGGKGSSSLFLAANASFVRDFTTPVNCWTAYTRGVHARVDAFGLHGNLTVFGQTQHYAGLGANFGILMRKRHHLDVAFLNFYTIPLNYRDQSATISAIFAPIASRPVQVGGSIFTMYGGYLRGEFFGARAGKLFTPPKGTHNGVIGLVVPLRKTMFLTLEYDPGTTQHNVGAAILYVFPRK